VDKVPDSLLFSGTIWGNYAPCARLYIIYDFKKPAMAAIGYLNIN
jgi:hypothetical protein